EPGPCGIVVEILGDHRGPGGGLAAGLLAARADLDPVEGVAELVVEPRRRAMAEASVLVAEEHRPDRVRVVALEARQEGVQRGLQPAALREEPQGLALAVRQGLLALASGHVLD